MGKKVYVIGGGPGGYVAAIRAAQLGADVTLVEKQYLGGTCLNVGCIPTKCLLHSAELMESLTREAAEIGVDAKDVTLNFPQVIAHKNAISKKLTGGIAGLLKMNHVTHLTGEAYFTGPGTMEVLTPEGEQLPVDADAVILATGSVNSVPPIPGIRENPNCIDSTGALSLETLPASLAVIGGGVIGLELACAYAAFGTKVTVIEALDHMLPMLDGDLVRVGQRHMKKMGINLHLGCPVKAVETSSAGAKVICTDKSGAEISVEAEKVLVAVGRKPNTASLHLDNGGIEHNRGSILVNERMETNLPGIYAIGDCVFGHAQLAHTASAMGEVAAENIMGGQSVYSEDTNPTCVYIEPEAASVGLSEEQAKELGIDCSIGRFPMAANGKALILNGGEGLVKILAEKESHKVLGLHIIGPRATDLVSEGALAIRLGATVEDIISTIHSHPTVTEAVREAALHADHRAIHCGNT